MLFFLSCQKEIIEQPEEEPTITIPAASIDVFDFETKTTHEDSLSLHAVDPDNYTAFISTLNGSEVDLFSSITLREAGYYELNINALTATDSIDLYLQFVIVDSERGEAEWGLRKFTPTAFEDTSFELSTLDFIYPRQYPKDLSIPIIFQSNDSKDNWENYYAHLYIDGHNSTIKRGIGSVLLSPTRSASNLEVILQGQNLGLDITDIEPTYTLLNGTIENDMTLEEGGFYHINADLTIEAGITLEIPTGCIIKVDEGINIHNSGHVLIEGTASDPVIFACAKADSYWGGFISIGDGTTVDVRHAIFAQSGFHDTPEYQYGHAKRQALFLTDDSKLTIRDSYAIDNAGQIFYLKNQSELTIENTLIQRAISAGEVSGSDVEISECTFTDFPEYSSQYLDQDNDCIYLSHSDAVISNSAFMWSKDDGIDSGGSAGGEVQIHNCHFEGIVHEAIALSSAGSVTKSHQITQSTFRNNGQGVELGYSSTNHQVTVDDCYFDDNMIGIRYGDNYERDVDGKMELINCNFGTQSDKDIWNFVRSKWSSVEEHLIY